MNVSAPIMFRYIVNNSNLPPLERTILESIILYFLFQMIIEVVLFRDYVLSSLLLKEKRLKWLITCDASIIP